LDRREHGGHHFGDPDHRGVGALSRVWFARQRTANAKWNKHLIFNPMLYYTLVFLLIALLAGALGFFAVAGVAAMIAKVLFVIFLVLFIVSLVSRKRL
jgi:uncharacterized membrane protein YtjA (UPF0391 family)